MNKKFITAAIVCLLGCSMLTTSCIGSFSLTNKLLGWNRNLGSKFVNELVFLCLWILPVYEISGLADLIVLNTIEFWSGNSPIAHRGTKHVTGNDGHQYCIRADRHGYTVTDLTDNVTVSLRFDTDAQRWDIVNARGERHELFTFVDDTHIALPGTDTPVELSQQGVMAYTQTIQQTALAAR